jgi:WD40 repeat protein
MPGCLNQFHAWRTNNYEISYLIGDTRDRNWGGISFHPDGRLFVTAFNFELRFYHAQTFILLKRVRLGTWGTNILSFSPDGAFLLVGSASELSVFGV